MKRVSVLIVCLMLPVLLMAQKVTLVKPESHTFYLNTLNSAKDSSYNDIIRLYDVYLEKNPSDYLVQIEKCKVIDQAYYDNYEEYNPKYEEFDACLHSLVVKFPSEPEVLLFKADHTYGDSAKLFLENVIEQYDKDQSRWKGKGIWKIYEQLARYYDDDEGTATAIRYAEMAKTENDTLDLSLFLAQQYKKQKLNSIAIAVLSAGIDSTGAAYELNQKGKLLLELGAPDKALEAFQIARRDTANWIDSGNLAQALIENGLASEAREYLVKEAESTWSHPKSLQKLLDYDMRFGNADSAKAVYTRMVNENFWYDALGVNRLKLFWYAPTQGWSISDVAHILLLLVLFLVIFILPYLWILPIYNIGLFLKNRKGLILPESDFRWGLRHFWMLSFLWLTWDLIAELIFNYNDWISVYTSNQSADVGELISKVEADTSLFFMTGMLIITCFFVKKSDLSIFWGGTWASGESIGRGIGAAFLLKFAAGLLMGFFKIFDFASIDFAPLLSVNDSIISINKYYHPMIGALFVVILVPIYEEVIFRGVILSAIEKHFKFVWANIFQATLFALLHMELKFIPFYILFGFLAGYLRSRSQSLLPGIVMHIVNNFMAFLSILWLGNRLNM
ncbi:MAG: CPBP family glutamic-type intramembrane protease [Chryseolinea sp.]